MPVDGDGAGILERLGDHLVEGEPLVLRAGAIELAQALDLLGLRFELARRGRDQHALEVLRGIDRGVADHEGHARGIGAVVLGHHVAVAGDDADAREIEPEHLGRRVCTRMVDEPWPISAAPESTHDRAVEVELELDGRVRLAGPVHRLRGAADVVRAGHAETFAHALPFGSLPLRAFQPLARSTQSTHSGRP